MIAEGDIFKIKMFDGCKAVISIYCGKSSHELYPYKFMFEGIPKIQIISGLDIKKDKIIKGRFLLTEKQNNGLNISHLNKNEFKNIELDYFY